MDLGRYTLYYSTQPVLFYQDSYQNSQPIGTNSYTIPLYFNHSNVSLPDLLNGQPPPPVNEQFIEKQNSQFSRLSANDKRKPVNISNSDERKPTTHRNMKANIIKDFVKGLKKESIRILMAKVALKADYSIRIFLQTLTRKLPPDGKYIRCNIIKQLCNSREDRQFGRLLRVVFLNFLRKDYKNTILLRKKSKLEYLKACRQIQQKVFS